MTTEGRNHMQNINEMNTNPDVLAFKSAKVPAYDI